MEYSITSSGLSMATGLAVDLYLPSGEESRRKEGDPKPRISSYTHLYINVQTLIENLINAVGAAGRYKYTPQEYYDVIYGELLILNNMSKLKTVAYVTPYDKIYGSESQSTYLRKATTKIAVDKEVLINNILKIVKKNAKIKQYAHLPQGLRTSKVMMITHIPYDLLAYSRFMKLTLLERNTGVVKYPSDFNSKYANIPGGESWKLPFTDRLLRIFGDKTMFKPMNVIIRKRLYGVLTSGAAMTAATGHPRIRTAILKDARLTRDKSLLDIYDNILK